VGQAAYEEIDYAPSGTSAQNWGWNVREGFHSYNGGGSLPGRSDPIIERPHSAGDCAIVGGYVYRGSVIPRLNGAYVYADFCTGDVRAIVQQNGTAVQGRSLGLNVSSTTTFGENAAGELFVASRGGTIYQITP